MKKSTRAVSAAEAKNNFSELLEDTYNHQTRYIIKRFGTPRAVLISLGDFYHLLTNEDTETGEIREEHAVYQFGEEQNVDDLLALLEGK